MEMVKKYLNEGAGFDNCNLLKAMEEMFAKYIYLEKAQANQKLKQKIEQNAINGNFDVTMLNDLIEELSKVKDDI